MSFSNSVLVSIISLVSFLPAAMAEDFGWTELAAVPVARFEAMGTTSDDKLIVLGGELNIRGGTTDIVNVFDPVTNTWLEGPGLPTALTHAGVAELDGVIYVVGGFKGDIPITNIPPSTDEVWRWNFRAWYNGDSSAVWEQGPSLPQAQAALSLVILNGELHAVSGLGPDGQQDVGDHWVLNIQAGWYGLSSWEQAAPLPQPRNHLGGAVVDNKIYVLGGRAGWDDLFGHQRAVDVYDPQSDSWEERRAIPFEIGAGLSHHEASTFAFEGRIYLVGGQANLPWPFVSKVRSYEPATDQWYELPSLPGSRKGPVAGLINRSIIVANGLDKSGDAVTTTYMGCCL